MAIEKLTKAEEDIMQIIWRLGPCTVRQIREDINPENPPPHSSVSTIVRILEGKGFLDHKAYGRTYEYRPVISRDAYRQFELQNLTEDYFEGSPSDLVSFLVKKEQISKTDLEEMMRWLENSDDQ